MLIATDRHNGYHVIRLMEDVHMDSKIPELRTHVEQCMENGAKKIALQFSRNSYLSSESIGLLAGCLYDLGKQGGTLALVLPCPAIIEVFQITGLLTHVEVCRSLAELGAQECPRIDDCPAVHKGRSTDEVARIKTGYCTNTRTRCARWLSYSCGRTPPPDLQPEQMDEAIERISAPGVPA